jgi:DNA processing protein
VARVTSVEASIALNMLPRMGPVRLRKLLEVYDSPERVLLARRDELLRVDGIGPDVAENIVQWESLVDLQAELQRIRDFGATVLTQNCSGYPDELKEIHTPPIVLYVWGTLNDRGVDTAAHQGALAANGRTVAVLGAGLNRLYPPENRALAEKIAAAGAVITEFSMEVEADRQTFPMRNRIISGCCSGLLVVEAGVKSGALISAKQALDEGRSVYAVPGRIDHPGAIGSNRLIQGGAKLVMSASDILEDMEMLLPLPPKRTPPPSRANTLSGLEKRIYEAIPDSEVTIDEIVAKCHLPTNEVSTTLLTLELRRFVKQLPGQRFVKLS